MEKLDRRSIMVILNPTSGGEDHKKIMGELLYKLKNITRTLYLKLRKNNTMQQNLHKVPVIESFTQFA